MGRNKCSTYLICKKHVVTRKCCLQVTICLEDKIFPQKIITILARKLSCVEGCNTCFHEAQPPSHFSSVTMVVGPSCSSFRFQTQAPPTSLNKILFFFGMFSFIFFNHFIFHFFIILFFIFFIFFSFFSFFFHFFSFFYHFSSFLL